MINRAEEHSAGLKLESTWFLELKKVIALKQSGLSYDEIRNKCVTENLFGMTSEYRSKRTCDYLIKRVKSMDETLIELFCNSDLATQKIINFVTVARLDCLFYEFLNEVYREKHIVGYAELTIADVNAFLTDKAAQDENMKDWTDSTFRRLRSIYFQFMVDANLVKKEKNKYIITPPILDIALERYLEYNGEEQLVKAITGVR